LGSRKVADICGEDRYLLAVYRQTSERLLMATLTRNHLDDAEDGEPGSPGHSRSPDEREAEHRRSPSGKVVYKAITKEADEELSRPSSALFWSGLAAGLSMGFSMVASGLLRHHLPEAAWAPLVSHLGYSVGFVIVILGRQQLFTENTLTPMLPLMQRKDAATLLGVLRLWGLVLAANLLGALLFAFVAARTSAFDPAVRREFAELGQEAMRHGFGDAMLRAVFAGWLIALLVWMLPFADSAHFFVIVSMTWLVSLGGFGHIIAGAVEVFVLAWAGERSWAEVVGRFIVPVLIGNVVGGVMLVAALNHAQVAAGKREGAA
jgi:formate/nitrite transporter FocA (FNT family)